MRIALTGDILRPEPQRQGVNIGRITAILGQPLGGIGIGLEIFGEAENPLTMDQWVATDDPSTGIDDRMKEVIFSGMPVVGFELPRNVIAELLRYGVPFLDVIDYPYRFVEGRQVFGVFGSARVPDGCAIPERDMKELMADRLAGAVPYPDLEGKTLVLGQVRYDRSLISGGKFVSLMDFAEQIPAYKSVYRPHPLAGNWLSEEMMAVAGIPAIGCGHEIYRAIFSCSAVIGVSSSTLYEAKLMGKKATFLAEREHIKNYAPVWAEGLVKSVLALSLG